MPLCQLSDFVRHVNLDGSIVILNLDVGEYDILNGVASRMWDLLLHECDHAACCEVLARDFHIDRQQAERDLLQFQADLESKNLVSNRSAQGRGEEMLPIAATKISRPWLTMAAAWYLWDTRKALDSGRFASMYLSLMKRASGRRIYDSSRKSDRAQRAFAVAEAFLVTRSSQSDCLPRSLALYRLLSAAGVACSHMIGVRTSPFEAHAWVVQSDDVLFDTLEYTNRFTVISRLGNA